MTNSMFRKAVLALGLTAMAGAASAHSLGLANIAVRTPAANVNANVGAQGRGSSSLLNVGATVGQAGRSGSLLNVQANVGEEGRNSASLLNLGATVGGLLGVKADVGGREETRCDFCGGGEGGVGGHQGW